LAIERSPHPIYIESRNGLDGLAQANPVFDLAANGTVEGLGIAPGLGGRWCPTAE